MSSTTNNLEQETQITASNKNDNIEVNQEENAEKVIVESSESNIQKFTDTVFTSTNLIILVGFLGAYGIVYYLSKRNNPEDPTMMTNDGSKTTSIVIDLFFLVIIGIILYTLYTSITSKPEDTVSGEVIDGLSEYIDNPMSVLISIFSIIGFYVLTYMFGLSLIHI